MTDYHTSSIKLTTDSGQVLWISQDPDNAGLVVLSSDQEKFAIARNELHVLISALHDIDDRLPR